VVSSSNANKLIKQRLCLLLATMAASDGADAGAELIQHAMRFAQPQSRTGHVSCAHAYDASMRILLSSAFTEHGTPVVLVSTLHTSAS